MTIKEQLLVDIIKLSNQKLLSRLYAVFQEIIKEEKSRESKQNTFENPFENWKGSFKTKTVEQILSPSYIYTPVDKNEIVGCWEGEETTEELLAMITK